MKHNFASRVKAGAMFLDEARPGWRRKIQLRQLDLNDGTMCVLGQVEGSYQDGIDNLSLSPSISAALGFRLFLRNNESGGRLYKRLTKAWKSYIRDNR